MNQSNDYSMTDEEIFTTDEETEEHQLEQFIFSWRLDSEMFKNSIFNKQKMRERVDIKKVIGFIKTNMGISYGGDNKYKHMNYKNELEQITKYKDCFNSKKNYFNASHHLPKHRWGRNIPSEYASLAVFRRQTRHSLCEGIYVDIDMKNAQPTILLEICKHHNLPKEALRKYVENPKLYREQIMTHHRCDKDTAKELPITLMMGGTYDGWLRNNQIEITNKLKTFFNLEIELKGIIEIVYANNKDTITKQVLNQEKKKWRNVEEEKRGTMGLWGQSVERLIQETSIKWLVDNKDFEIEDIIPCQDGFMILRELYYENILNDISQVVKDKFNISIEYAVKPFDEFIEIPTIEGSKDYDEWYDLLNEKRIADRFFEEYGHFTSRNNDQIYIYYETKNEDGDVIIGRWYDETNKDRRYKLSIYISENMYNLLYKELNEEEGLTQISLKMLLKDLRQKTSNRISKIIEHILPKIREGVKFNDNPLLLGFTNGVVELPTKTFRPYRYDDYMTIHTGYEYVEIEENDFTAEKHNELIDIFVSIQPDEEQRELLVQFLASGLDGNLYQKLFLLNGKGGNGKGLLSKLMRFTLGEYFYQPPNTIIKDFEKGQSASPELYNCKGKRYINFTEVDGRVRVAMLRNLTGGGIFSARLLHQNPEIFNLIATFCMEFNNAPDLDGKPMDSDYRRLVHLEFPINFTDDENKIGKVLDGTKYEKANSYYTTDEFVLMIRPYFLNLLLDCYKTYYEPSTKCIGFTIPKAVRDRTERFIESQNKFKKFFNDTYYKCEVKILEDGTYDPVDKERKMLYIKEFWASFQNSIEYRDIKTTRQRQEYGRDECYKWLRSSFDVKQDKKKGDYVLGIMNKEEEEER